jgi:hypothetical protein
LTGAVRAPRGNTAAQKKARRGGKGKERQMKITGKGRAEYVAGPGDDWDLEDLGGGDEGEGELMERSIRLGLPVCVTLNLVSWTAQGEDGLHRSDCIWFITSIDTEHGEVFPRCLSAGRDRLSLAAASLFQLSNVHF